MSHSKRIIRSVALLLASLAFIAWPPARARLQSPQSDQQNATRPRRAGETAPAQTRPPAKGTKEGEQTVDEDEVVRIDTDLTNLLFTAIDKDKRYVTTLQQTDVRVLEDGTPQEIFRFERQTDMPLSLAILIDTSASQERTLPEEKEAASAFIDNVLRENKDEAAVISFTGEATLEQGLTGSASRLRRAIEQVRFVPPSGYVGGGVVVGGTPPISGTNQGLAGSTAIWDAVWVAADEILSQTPERTRRAIILLTDGEDTSSRLKPSEAIDRVIKSDAVVYSIGIGDRFEFGIDEGALRKLSEKTGGRAFFPRSEADLRSAFRQIQEELRSQYLIAYSPTNKKRDGSYRQVQIEIVNPELRKQKLRLVYRQGYFAKSSISASTAPTK